MRTAAQHIKDSIILLSQVAWYVTRNTFFALTVTVMFLISVGLWISYATQSTNRGTRKADRVLKAHNAKLALVWARF